MEGSCCIVQYRKDAEDDEGKTVLLNWCTHSRSCNSLHAHLKSGTEPLSTQMRSL